MTSESQDIDWERLAQLRREFLQGTAGSHDYWRSESDLASYDATFAQRIGWKWDFVLEDLARIGWTPPEGTLLDWACGSGIAGRAFLDHFGTDYVTEACFADRSAIAVRYAVRRARTKFPNLTVEAGLPPSGSAAILLISHALTELPPAQLEHALNLARRATAVLWVEPGTHEASRALVDVRERLRTELHPIAPCVYAGPCGLLAAGLERHWCHHFAAPPPEVFTDPFWGRFAQRMEIDLRSVPLSYLVLDRRPPRPLPERTVRVLGRPRLGKADVRWLVCNEHGVRDISLARRRFPTAWTDARKGRTASLQTVPEGTQGEAAPPPNEPESIDLPEPGA